MPSPSPTFFARSAPRIAALFPRGVAAFEAQGPCSANCLFDVELPSISRALEPRVSEFAAGRVCARGALEQVGHSPGPIPAGADRAPIWPQGFTGSISHSDGYCVGVASKVKNAYQESGVSALGVDIERMGRVVPELWPQLMRDEELSRLQTLSARERDVSATLIFSAKEAFYKAQYSLTGTWVDFGDAAIELLIDSFVVHVKNTALPIAQHSRTFKGRYFVSAEQVVTALAI